jgi:hypothetical protein
MHSSSFHWTRSNGKHRFAILHWALIAPYVDITRRWNLSKGHFVSIFGKESRGEIWRPCFPHILYTYRRSNTGILDRRMDLTQCCKSCVCTHAIAYVCSVEEAVNKYYTLLLSVCGNSVSLLMRQLLWHTCAGCSIIDPAGVCPSSTFWWITYINWTSNLKLLKALIFERYISGLRVVGQCFEIIVTADNLAYSV